MLNLYFQLLSFKLPIHNLQVEQRINLNPDQIQKLRWNTTLISKHRHNIGVMAKMSSHASELKCDWNIGVKRHYLHSHEKF